MYKDGIGLGSRRRDAEGAHVPRMQVRRGRAQQRRTVHGCQEGQDGQPGGGELVEVTSQESQARRRGTTSGACATRLGRAIKPARTQLDLRPAGLRRVRTQHCEHSCKQ
jgi:hypothetical protein